MSRENNRIVSTLNTVIDANTDKYEYYTARYLNNPAFSIRATSEWDIGWGYSFEPAKDADLASSAYTNVIKSVIDTLVSKIAAQKVRPFFNPVNGTYKTRKVVKCIQTYFDNIYDKANIHELMSDAFRMGCICGRGAVYINPITYKISTLPAWTYAYLNSESKYETPKRMLIKYRTFPTVMLKDYGIDAPRNQETVTLWHYIDAINHTQELYVNGNSRKTLKYEADVLPIVELFYNKPVFGNQTLSIVQELDGIQTQIDLINSKISACAQLSPANTTYVIEGSNLSPSDVDNRVGKVYGIRMPPGTNTPPVVNVAPPLFDNQWMNLLEYYIKQAYEITGVSQLSAMSKKPSGADSGIALQTLEDVESDRLEIAMNHYIQAYTDLAKVIIAVLPEKEDILPESLNTSTLKWKDVKKQTDLFKIQYSTATALSNNPSEKLKQVMQMSQVGLIDQSKIAKYLDMPDMQDAFNGATAANDGVEQCIQRAIEYEDFEIPDFVNYQMLAQSIAKEENTLYAAVSDNEENNEQIEESLVRLMKLEENLLTIMEENGFVDLGNDVEEQQVSETGELSSGAGSTEVADITSTLNQGEQSDLTGMGTESEMAEDEALANPTEI